LADSKAGAPAVTVKPLDSVSTSVPVVSVIVRAPVAAVALMFTNAVALNGELTVRDATVIPAPKLAVAVPCTQFVNCPARVMDKLDCPCWPVFGLADNNTGVPAVTVKPLDNVSISPPVVRVIDRAPVAAEALMLTTAVALAGEVTVRDATVIPAPKLAVVVPCTQLVNWPASVTDRFC
jgi:hypothetical protein